MGIPALKEWAVVVRALLAGEQILDVRKGGIREEGRHFGLDSNRFWLYPTVEHQEPALLKPAYQRWVDEEVAAAPPARAIRVAGWADVVEMATVTEAEALEAIDGKLIWTLNYAQSRLKWKSRDPLWVLALRVHCLDEPIVVPFREEYAGCTSWVDLEGLPDDPAAVPSEPALTDMAFEGRLSQVRSALGDLQPI